MTTITKYIVAIVLCLCVTNINAQNKDVKTDTIVSDEFKKIEINKLNRLKEEVKIDERGFLKVDVRVINRRLDRKEITAEEAEKLKKEAANKRAANIADKLAIIDKKIEIIKRTERFYEASLPSTRTKEDMTRIRIGGRSDSTSESLVYMGIQKYDKPKRYDIRTKDNLIFAIGFNNAITDGQSLGDTPYKLGGSGFVELGWQWQTRIFKESNFARINYGLSLQWNKLDIKDDQYFVQNGDQTTLENFPFDLRQAKFRVTNLVVPVHLEFGGSTKKQYDNRVRYSTHNNFKFGIGGYGGVRLGSVQKLRYDDADNNRVKSKEKDFNASNFVYGISGYIGYSDIALFAKYDLNPLFKDQAVDQHNISLGLRWTLD